MGETKNADQKQGTKPWTKGMHVLQAKFMYQDYP